MSASDRTPRIKTDAVLAAVSDVLSQLVAMHSPQRLFERLLATILEVTDSEFGFIGEVRHSESGAPYLQTFAISDISWDDELRRRYEESAASGFEFHNLDSLFGVTLRTGQAYVSNSPSEDPHRVGLPIGHPPLSCYVGIPFLYRDEMLGMIGIANSPHGYDEDLLETLSPLLNASAAVIVQLRHDEQQIRDEQRLRESEEQVRSLINNLPGPAYRCLWEDNVWQIDYVSDGAEEVTGYTSDFFAGYTLEKFLQIVHPDDVGLIEEYMTGVVERLESPPLEYRLIHKNGQTVWIHSRSQVVSNKKGEILCFDGLLLDITDRRLAEEALAEANSFNAAVINSASRVAVIATDCSGTITLFNVGAERLLGYSARDIVNELPVIELICPNELQARKQELWDLYADRVNGFEILATPPRTFGADDREWTLIRRDLRHVLARVVITAMRGPDDKLTGYLLIGVDITQQKRTEAQLIDARRTAENANQLKSQFLANMSHEIRTPMTAIIGYTDLLTRSMSSAFETEALSTIKRNSEHLVQLINDILDLSKIESGNLTLESVPCNPADIVREVQELLQVKAKERGNAIFVEVDDEVPPYILSDPTRFRQILLNLAGNAVKFTKDGQVTIRLSARMKRPMELEICVQDNGIGMTLEQVASIFKPFRQADSTMTRRYGGTGLGLTISLKLVELLHGTIETQSRPDKGSTFFVTLPMHLPSSNHGAIESDSAIAASLAARANQSTDPAELLRGYRVLLADDAPVNQRLIQHQLEASGCKIDIVDDGQKAVERALELKNVGNPFDLILMDMQMPVMNGFDAVMELRQKGYQHPIIALTANVMTGDKEKCLEVGCDDYVAKPIDWDLLLLTMCDLLNPQQKA